MKLTPSVSYLTGFCFGDCASQSRSGYVQLVSGSAHPGFLQNFLGATKRCRPTSYGLYPGKRVRPNGNISYTWFCWALFPRDYETFFRADHASIISIVAKNERLFYSFLAGFADAEGNWQPTKNHEDGVQFSFRIFSTDVKLLGAIAAELQKRGFSCSLRLKERAGSRIRPIKLKRDYWLLRISKRAEVIMLAKKLLRYSLHSEKKRKMRLFVNCQSVRSWTQFEKMWRPLQFSIKKEVKASEVLAQAKYAESRKGKASK